MKKQILLVLGFILVACQLFAQSITLTQTSYPSSVFTTDTIATTTTGSSFPTLTSMANATWDLTSITDTSLISYVYRVPTTYYEFADSNLYSFGTYSYKGNVQSSITSAGLLEYGIIIPWTGYNISAVTFGPTDSLIIIAQSDTFSAPDDVINFPATFNSTWSSTFHNDFNYELSVAAYGLIHSPGIVRSYSTETDSVKGWGIMRVKNLSGDPSSYFNVLQVQKTVVTVDSFFLPGASPIVLAGLLTALHFTEGQTTTNYYQDYYRVEEVTPFAEVDYNDATFSHPVKAYTNTQNMVNEGVANVPDKTGVAIYPNPVTGGVVSITLPESTGTWSFDLIDITGQTVQSAVLNKNGNNAQFALSPSLTPGIYYIKVNNNGTQYCVKPIEILK